MYISVRNRRASYLANEPSSKHYKSATDKNIFLIQPSQTNPYLNPAFTCGHDTVCAFFVFLDSQHTLKLMNEQINNKVIHFTHFMLTENIQNV